MNATDDSLPTVRVDFQNADAAGRVRLNTVGAIEDIQTLELPLGVGQTLRLIDDELTVVGRANFSDDEHVWVAEVDWKQVIR